jgi:protein-disulfide isomerase
MPRACRILLVLSFFFVSTATAQTDVRADIPLIQRADTARIIGSDTAQVMIDEFIDFACPDCRQFHMEKADSLQALVAERNAILIIRVFPIPRLMRGFQAAEAAFCAAAFAGQPGFLGMLDQLFTYQNAWRGELDPTPFFEAYAEDLNVPLAEFRDCMKRDAMAPLIINDIRLAKDAGVLGTPTFVFNKAEEFNGDEQFYGVQPMSRFEESIETVRQR